MAVLETYKTNSDCKSLQGGNGVCFQIPMHKNSNAFTIFLVFQWEAGATITTHHSPCVGVSIEELLYLALHPPSPLEVESVEVRAPSAEAQINSALQPSEARCLPAHNNSASKIASPSTLWACICASPLVLIKAQLQYQPCLMISGAPVSCQSREGSGTNIESEGI